VSTDSLSLPEQLAFTTVRIQCQKTDGRNSSGTGFIFNFSKDTTLQTPALITNRHVVADAQTAILKFTRAASDGRPRIGTTTRIHVSQFKNACLGHPDVNVDLVAIPPDPPLGFTAWLCCFFGWRLRLEYCVKVEESFGLDYEP